MKTRNNCILPGWILSQLILLSFCRVDWFKGNLQFLYIGVKNVSICCKKARILTDRIIRLAYPVEISLTSLDYADPSI